ncbi:MAG: sensor histidine kinase [Promethearchaeota archaeon]
MKIKNFADKIKIVIIIVLLIFSSILNYIFQIVLEINIFFSHFFYIPTILACFWWKRYGLFIPIYLAVSLILFPFFFGIIIDYLHNLEQILRAIMIIIVGIIVSVLSEHISKTKEFTKAYSNILFYRDLISHDMNNIFQNILSSTELHSIIKKNSNIVDEQDELIKIIRDQCFRGVRLTLNVQNLTKLEDSQFYLKKVNLKEILNESIKNIKNYYQDKEITFDIEAPNKILWIKANELLSEIFINLFINSVKYNESPIVEIKIKVSNEKINSLDYLKIEVKDNGIGIPDERKKIIFERRNKKNKYSKGMGIGLSIVKGILNKYNGKIWVEDKVFGDYSKGSNFIILIPQAFD